MAKRYTIHIDEDKDNNCITNLAVFETQADHLRFHRSIRVRLKWSRGTKKWTNGEEAVKDILYSNYGIVFYGPFYKNKVKKHNNAMAEKMKHDLGLRETEALYLCQS